jgi:hypothetical protein
LEIGRRLTERGVFQEPDDVWFLCRRELWPVFFGAPLTPLLKAKMAARRRDFDRMAAREVEQPTYLKNGGPVDLEIRSDDEPGLFRGSGTARGKATGRANVVRQLKDIGKVKEGDILVVNATGTPSFICFLACLDALLCFRSGVRLMTAGLAQRTQPCFSDGRQSSISFKALSSRRQAAPFSSQ